MKREKSTTRGYHRIKRLGVAGGFLDGLSITFADGLNCIIGPRGTGKTTIIELLRFGLDAMPGREGDTKAFTAEQLCLLGDWSCVFPASLGRFPIQGSGKRYVHGGFSLQEVIVPVVHIHKARADDTGRVSVELMRVPAKITTGQVSLSLYQEKPVTAKLLPRELRVGVFARDGTPLSEIKPLKCDSGEEEARKRETNVVLVLSKAADDYNNKEVDNGDAEPDLAAKPVPSEAKTWVYREFSGVRSLADLKRFVATGRHLWILHVILKSMPNKQILVEALTALSECVEHCQNTLADGKQKRVAIQASESKWIAKLIKARIPNKLDLSKAFVEALFAINSTAALSETVLKESNGLNFRLKEIEEELAGEKKARTSAEQQAHNLQEKLTSTIGEMEKTRKELEEERLHSTRQGGFNVVARNETINHVLSLVRQGITHRLENIRAYADRENPDREEIVALVAEIEKHLSGIEEAARQ